MPNFHPRLPSSDSWSRPERCSFADAVAYLDRQGYRLAFAEGHYHPDAAVTLKASPDRQIIHLIGGFKPGWLVATATKAAN